jgi:hypothetical protein
MHPTSESVNILKIGPFIAKIQSFKVFELWLMNKNKNIKKLFEKKWFSYKELGYPIPKES